ncbi:nSTAND1 domain-containing NTPase [Fulvivirga lutea]|uniref:Novel STAND NTPase 1 domain-containing protein n=1 Tax=Fulvivirga lutea TaxID=2810512 RepID=A0A975A001_9BACT|nr:hypothetical protein [Fulvivirga lutea]QSE96726.1 hypothetical protein JR347_14140 [Fulvivirga lutea]
MLNYELHQNEEEHTISDVNVQNDVVLNNPFPGLRPFSVEENHLFFGRESQVDEVLLKLATNKFVTVMGYSGSGKSSLIYCGVVPVVYGGFMTEVGPDWNIIMTRPGTSPIHNLGSSIQRSLDYGYMNKEEARINRRVISSILRTDPNGLVEVLAKKYQKQKQNTLIFIDQFEELFRYGTSDQESAEEARLYVNLILDACRNSQFPVYIAITMRSDYVGECAKFPGLTQLINESNYLVPQMSRDQKRMAIEGPIAVGGGQISERLLKRLLNDLGDNQDQLPILQHALMRTWNYWLKNKEEGEPMDIGHYNAIGRITEALSQHANETFDELSSRQKEIAEILFKSLTEKSSNNFGMRRPVKLSFVADLADATEEEVIEVVDHFRAPGRSFLMPPPNVRLNSDSLIEISHESLMRIWTRLKVWVDEEFESAQMYRRLSEAAAMYQIGRTGLWRPPDLQLALNWQKKQKPTRAWARRYDEAFERAIVFLDTSRITYEAEQRNQEMLQKRLVKRTKAVAIFLGFAAVISILFFVYALTQSTEAKRQAELAEAEKIEAQKQRDIANEATIEAQEQTKKAEEALADANEQRKRAEEALSKAEYERLRAEQNFQIAQEQTNIANDQKVVAQEARDEARNQFKRAEENYRDAQRLLYQSIAQSMAVKSLSIEDNDLKGALAQQAKIFFDEYQGRHYDPYIYNGLYAATADFIGRDYNTIPKLHRNAVRSVAVANNSPNYFTTGTQGKLVKSTTEDQSNNMSLFSNQFPNRALSISNNDQWLAIASDSAYIQVLNTETNSTSKITGHKGYVNDVEFSNGNNEFYSTGSDRTIRRNNIESLRSELVMNTQFELKAIDLNSNGSQLIAGTIEGNLTLYDLESKSESVIFNNPGVPIHSVQFSQDNKLIVFGDEKGVIHVMNANSKAILYELVGHKGRVSTIAFSPDNKLMASGSFDGVIQMWPVKELGELPIRITDNDAYVWDIKFSSDSEYIISACADGDVRLWPTNPDKFSDQLCEYIKRNMTEEEWKTYVGDDIKYRATCVNLLVEDY